MTGITFDNKVHTYKDWGLKLLSVYIPMPNPKRQIINIPGGDGSIDLTEVQIGRPAYADREGVELIFDLMDGDYKSWLIKYSMFAKEIHGRKVRMVLDDEPDHYYMVRLTLDSKKTNRVYSQIILNGSADPFKYDVLDTTDEWLWDSFNFKTGVIRTTQEVTITSSSTTTRILGAGIDTAPEFVVTQANNLKLFFEGRTYTLRAGRNRFPAVRVGEDDLTLTFSGTGRLTVEYRGRYL